MANVHHTTASRALRNSPEIHADTALRVRAAAAELGYVPNVHAQALKRASDRPLVAMIVDTQSVSELSRYAQPFWLALFMGLTSNLATAGAGLVQIAPDAIEVLDQMSPRAMMLISLISEQIDLPKSLANVPLVTERNHIMAKQAVATVGHNHDKIAAEACQYMRSRGSRRVAYLPLSSRDLLSIASATGYRAWSARVGNEQYIIDPSLDPATQEETVAKAVAAGVDGIYVTGGELAAVVHGIRRMGKECPDDVQILSIGEGTNEQLLDPPFSSINLHGARCAREIASLFARILRNERVSDITFDYQLIPRGSTRG